MGSTAQLATDESDASTPRQSDSTNSHLPETIAANQIGNILSPLPQAPSVQFPLRKFDSANIAGSRNIVAILVVTKNRQRYRTH